MSNCKKHQMWCEIGIDKIIINNNKDLSKLLIECLSHYYKRQIYQSVAQRLDESMFLTRNWFQRGTAINAYHMILLMRNYDFIRDIIYEMVEY